MAPEMLAAGWAAALLPRGQVRREDKAAPAQPPLTAGPALLPPGEAASATPRGPDSPAEPQLPEPAAPTLREAAAPRAALPRREPELSALADVAEEILDSASARAEHADVGGQEPRGPGWGGAGPALFPPGSLAASDAGRRSTLGLPAADSRAVGRGAGRGSSGPEPGPGQPLAAQQTRLAQGVSGEAAAWAVPVAVAYTADAMHLSQKKMQPIWSIREKLSARCGRLHAVRQSRRICLSHDHGGSLKAPESDPETDLRAEIRQDRRARRGSRHRRRRGSGRSRRRRDRGRGASSSGSSRERRKRRRPSPSSSPTRSSDSAAVFRDASSAGAAVGRAASDALRRPHVALLDSLEECSLVLPRAAGEAAPTRIDLFRELPSIYEAHYEILVKRHTDNDPGSKRTARELMTLSRAMDQILRGEALEALMTLLGRHKALRSALDNCGGGWSVARHHEVLPPEESLVGHRDRVRAARDQRDLLKTENMLAAGSSTPARSGRPLPRQSSSRPRGRSAS